MRGCKGFSHCSLVKEYLYYFIIIYMEEIWKKIEWYENYEVSSLWRIKSLVWWKEKIRKLNKNRYWYIAVLLSKDTNKKLVKIHRIVASAFISNKENKPQVNHIDWDKSNNNVSNLEWCTPSENALHSIRILWNNNHLKTNHPSLWKFWKEHFNSKIVLQYDLNDIFIKQWDSLSDIWRILWISIWHISSCCNWKKKTTGWFKWKYS